MSRYFEHIAGLSGKTAVITGASDGIGVGIAKALAAAGAAVSINFASSKLGADRVDAEIKAKGGNAVTIQGDVAKAADVRRIFAETKEAFGRVDILVNNASVHDLLSLEEMRDESLHRYFNINVLGVLLATQEATRLFGAEGGRVVNVNSVVSDLDPRGSAYYTATKTAIDSVTRALAMDLSAKKIRVNSMDVIVQLSGALPPKGNAIEFAEDSIVEYVSNSIRLYGISSFLDSGTTNIHLRRPNSMDRLPFATEGVLSHPLIDC